MEVGISRDVNRNYKSSFSETFFYYSVLTLLTSKSGGMIPYGGDGNLGRLPHPSRNSISAILDIGR